MPTINSPPSTFDFMKKMGDKGETLTNSSEWLTWLNNLYEKITGSTRQILTATGSVGAGIESLELNHATVVIAATIANSLDSPGFFIVKDTSASGTAAHTCTLTAGTWDGTNTIATLNAPGEALMVYFDSSGNGVIIENINGVGLS